MGYGLCLVFILFIVISKRFLFGLGCGGQWGVEGKIRSLGLGFVMQGTRFYFRFFFREGNVVVISLESLGIYFMVMVLKNQEQKFWGERRESVRKFRLGLFYLVLGIQAVGSRVLTGFFFQARDSEKEFEFWKEVGFVQNQR